MLPPLLMVTIKIQGAKFWLFLPLLALLALFAGCVPPGPRALLDGRELLDAGKPREAAELFKEATALMPTNALAFNYLGLASHQAGQLPEAERAYARALLLDRDLAEVHFNRGCLYLEDNRLEQARSDLTAYTLRRSQDPRGFIKLGSAQLRSRDSAAAERSFAEALRLKPEDPEALTGIGLAKLQRNRAPEATIYFSKALQAQPRYRPALQNLAVVAQEKLKDRQLALRTYRQLLDLKPSPEEAQKITAAITQLEYDLTPLQPAPLVVGTPSTNSGSAKLSSVLKPVQNVPSPAATNVSKPAMVEKPKPANLALPKPTVGFAEAKAPVAAASPPKVAAGPSSSPVAARPLETVTLGEEPAPKTGQDPLPLVTVQAKPTTTNITSVSAPASVEKKQTKNGLLQKINPARLFTDKDQKKPGTKSGPPSPSAVATSPVRGSTNDPETPRSRVARYAYLKPAKPAQGNSSAAQKPYADGIEAYKGQRFSEAIDAYRRAIELDPAFFNAYYNLALAETRSGATQAALKTCELALVLRPDHIDTRYNFALALKNTGYPLDAANELEKVIASAPQDSRAHLALANLYAQQLGNVSLARKHYQKVLELDPGNSQASAIHFWLAGRKR